MISVLDISCHSKKLTGAAAILADEASRLFLTDSLVTPSLWDLAPMGTEMFTRAANQKI